jgi:O-antigen/teichoic acid export membrane protein
MDAMTNNIPLVVMSTVYGAQVAGWMTLVQRIVGAPLALLTGSVGQVYFEELSNAKGKHSSSIAELLRRRVRQHAYIAMAIGSVASIGSLFIPLVFGSEWTKAVVCAWIMIPMMVAGFTASPFGFTLEVLQRQDLHLARETARASIMLAALVAARMLQANWWEALGLISAAGTMNAVVYLSIAARAVRAYEYVLRRQPLSRAECNTALDAI